MHARSIKTVFAPLVISMVACASDVAETLEQEDTQHIDRPQLCSKIVGAQLDVSDEAQIVQDSAAFYPDGLIIFDYDSPAPGQRQIGVQLKAFANTDQGSVEISEGLSVRLVARYCDGQVREAVVNEPEQQHWGNVYTAKFDQTSIPMTTPRQWQLTLTWNGNVLSYLFPATADFEVRWRPARASSGPAIVEWTRSDFRFSRITAAVDDVNMKSYTQLDAVDDGDSAEFADYQAGHGYTATVAKELWSELPGIASGSFNVHTRRTSDPFYFLAPAAAP